MNVSKIITAAKLLVEKNPVLSKELLKIAQELAPQSITNTNDSSNLAVNNMNPNIDDKYVKNVNKSETETHKVTLTLEVPSNYDELKIMNALLPITKEMETSGITLKGYQFNER